MTRARGWAAVTGLCLLAAACGKRGSPLPPLRPVPARVSDVTAVRTDGRVTLHLTVPNANADGSTPVAIDRIDIYRTVTPASALAGAPAAPAPESSGVTVSRPPPAARGRAAGAARGRGAAAATGPPTASVIVGNPKNLLQQLAVRPAPVESSDTAGDASTRAKDAKDAKGETPEKKARARGESTAVPDTRPLSGTAVSIEDEITPAALAAGGARNYVVVPVAGKGRGRPGVASAVLTVTLTDLPARPQAPRVTYDEQHLTATWDAVTGEVVSVLATAASGEPADAHVLTPEPIAAATFTEPVEFGKPICLALRASRTAGAVRADSAISPATCLTPVDTFPPAGPTGLQAVQEGDAVTLIWNRVDAADLGGYIVLRGDGTSGTLQPLMRAPLQDVTYRDTTVRTGQAYTYAVYAVDRAPTPNISPLSDRQSVVVR